MTSAPLPMPPRAPSAPSVGASALATRLVRSIAAELGFPQLAVGAASEVSEHALYRAWLAADLAGDMVYLASDAETRRDPRRLLESAKSVVSVAVSYAHPEPLGPSELSDGSLRGQIARYARAEDYHLVLKRRLGRLAERLAAELGAAIGYRVCVDSAPLLERALGARAGLGFVGKNTLLITPGVGSYTVLGELLLDLELESGVAQPPRCGSCRLCLEVCPTGAIIDEYRVDARRCISYLTIENSGAIPRELRRAVGSWIFGCDLCQEVCPWNAASTSLGSDGRPRGDDELRPRPAQSRPQLLWLLGLGAAQFRRFVKRTALRRLGRSQLLRNVAVALGNLGTVAELPALASALGREPPLVRQHLVWAIGEIAARDPAARAIAQPLLEQSRDSDEDSAVREEATVALTAAVR